MCFRALKFSHHALKYRLMQIVAPELTRLLVAVLPPRREYPLPGPIASLSSNFRLSACGSSAKPPRLLGPQDSVDPFHGIDQYMPVIETGWRFSLGMTMYSHRFDTSPPHFRCSRTARIRLQRSASQRLQARRIRCRLSPSAQIVNVAARLTNPYAATATAWQSRVRPPTGAHARDPNPTGARAKSPHSSR